MKANGGEAGKVRLGRTAVKEPGPVPMDLRGVRKTGSVFAEVSELVMSSPTEGHKLSCVSNNNGNVFYCDRHSPSVHLGYEMPRDRRLQ